MKQTYWHHPEKHEMEEAWSWSNDTMRTDIMPENDPFSSVFILPSFSKRYVSLRHKFHLSAAEALPNGAGAGVARRPGRL